MSYSTLKILFMLIIFLGGLYFYIRYTSNPKMLEGLTTINGEMRCPNLLIQKGTKYYLYNSNLAQVPGVNPIEFNDLEEYTEFLEWQRGAGIRCPVLYVQNSYDAQGERVYKVRPSVSEPQAGLPPSAAAPMGIASSSGKTIMESSLGSPDALAYPNPTLLVDATRNDPPYNKDGYPAHDQTDYYVGTTTPLDMMDVQQEQSVVSPNPMDPNWGGADYTQSLVDRGYYSQNEVQIAIP
jgi:hypothetical protein